MKSLCATLVLCAIGCSHAPAPPRAPYLPLAELEAVYGPLIAAANHPTPDQHGTGDRMGLFRDQTGTVWGLPLTIAGDGAVLGCAPASVHDAPVTDTLPSDTENILGGTNAPTGWRGGTGQLELVYRTKSGAVRTQLVKSGALAAGPVCWAQEPPGPSQRLEYYRLAQAAH